MDDCMYHMICFGVKMYVCMYHACLLYCHELAETIARIVQHAQIAKVVTENERKRSLFIAWQHKNVTLALPLLLVCPCYRPLIRQHMDTNGQLSKTWILLDNQSTVDIFYNGALLTNICRSISSMDIHHNAGVAMTNMVGDLCGYGMVQSQWNWKHPISFLCKEKWRKGHIWQ